MLELQEEGRITNISGTRGGGRTFNCDGQAQFFCFLLTTGPVILVNNFRNRFKNSDPYHPYPTRILPSLIQLRCYLLLSISDLTFSYPTQILHSLIQLRSYILLSNSDFTFSYPTQILHSLLQLRSYILIQLRSYNLLSNWNLAYSYRTQTIKKYFRNPKNGYNLRKTI